VSDSSYESKVSPKPSTFIIASEKSSKQDIIKVLDQQQLPPESYLIKSPDLELAQCSRGLGYSDNERIEEVEEEKSSHSSGRSDRHLKPPLDDESDQEKRYDIK
jgi:hypothetical protein